MVIHKGAEVSYDVYTGEKGAPARGGMIYARTGVGE